MRIWLVSNMYPSRQNPIFGIFVRDSARELEKRGAIVVKTVRYSARGVIENLIKYMVFCARSARDGLSMRYDLIYIHFVKRSGLPAALYKLFRKVPVVVNFHGTDAHAKGFWKLVTAIVVRLADLIIVPSNYYVSLLQHRFPVGPEKIEVSASGGIPEYFSRYKRDGAQRGGRKETGPLTVGYVSGIRYEKGWSFLLDALKLVNDLPIKVTMIGNGPDFEIASKRIEENNLPVDLIPAVPRRNLAAFYNSFDVMVFPSLRESLGLVGLEAMACGVPVIGSDIEGIREYLQDGYNGMAVKPGDAGSIARALRSFAALSPYELEKYRAAAEQTAEKFRMDVVMDSLYSRLVSLVERR